MYNALICNTNTSHPCKGKEINLEKLNPYIVCGESTPAENKLIHRHFCEYNFAVFSLTGRQLFKMLVNVVVSFSSEFVIGLK